VLEKIALNVDELLAPVKAVMKTRLPYRGGEIF
jgi:hypothetical protein